jgi:NitT/TauT family transport system substrate-binding protein
VLRVLTAISALLLAAAVATPSHAEVGELRVGKQYGLPYIQFIIMEDQKLIEKHAKRMGLGDLNVVWATMGGPAALNDGLISGGIDLAGVGLPNLITLWEKTQTNARIRAIAGMNAMPLILLTRNPSIKSLKDYTQNDRIAVPSVKISMQAILLEMAAAQAFGRENWEKLDPLTVSMGHPDAVAALSSGGEITSHFSSAPFQYRQLKQPGYHQVLSSYDIVGPHSVSALSMTSKFHDGNPKTVEAILAALKDVTGLDQGEQEGRRGNLPARDQGQEPGRGSGGDAQRSQYHHHDRADGRGQDQRLHGRLGAREGEARDLEGLLLRRRGCLEGHVGSRGRHSHSGRSRAAITAKPT